MFSKHISMFQSDLRYWQRQGLDLLELLTSASLPTSLLTENDERLDAAAIQRLFEQAEKKLGDPAMGIRIGQQILLPDIAPLGDALHYYRDGWQALKVLEQYWPLLTEAQQVTVHVQDKYVAVRCAANGEMPIHAMQTHAVLSGFLRLADVVLGVQASNDVKVHLRESSPHTELFSALLKAPVTGGCQYDQVLFPATVLDSPNPNHDDERFQQALIQCDRTLNSLRDHHLIDLIRERLRLQLEKGHYDQQQLASSLNMSVRNLQRRLNAHHTRFRDLLDQVRAELAEQLVRYSEAGFAEIAHQLGYEDPSSFNKAFKRWLGLPPGEYRARHQDSTPSA
ncbi:AraC family transcriptional regulator [Alcanivorax sp.]|uniref:AraC family transcriptional regulator n=1 Tax=Alcanivorax sp. TaxID=1872427 RepID=UPI002B267057|nr:helix-turn-helix domain-containing protein [Alcanivorax sp.]